MNILARIPLKSAIALVLLSYVIVRYAPPAGSPDSPKSLSLGYAMHPDLLKYAEFYPLSSFPMYSKFSPNPNYVYITDESGNPIAHGSLGALSSAIKKDYDRRLRSIKVASALNIRDMTPDQKSPAGNAALRHVISNASPQQLASLQAKSLQLYEVTLTIPDGGGIGRSAQKVGEISL